MSSRNRHRDACLAHDRMKEGSNGVATLPRHDRRWRNVRARDLHAAERKLHPRGVISEWVCDKINISPLRIEDHGHVDDCRIFSHNLVDEIEHRLHAPKHLIRPISFLGRAVASDVWKRVGRSWTDANGQILDGRHGASSKNLQLRGACQK
eukprot:6176938-Pleurochrysis_carterae.AAC.2